MKRQFEIGILLLTICIAVSCSTTYELSEEDRAAILAATPFKTEEIVKVEYEPLEVVRYVLPEASSRDEAKDIHELFQDNRDGNTITVSNPSDFRNGIVEYNFLDGKIYEIFTSPDNVTDLRLEPGENISGEAAIGDSFSWQFTAATSMENGQVVNHIYIKPLTIGLETSMVIPTDRRTYYLKLSSYESLSMIGIRWKYPSLTTFRSASGEAYAMEVSPASALDTLLTVEPSSLNWKYSIKGSKSIWKPISVFDDGVHTYFQFDPRFETAAGAPALYLLPSQWKGNKSVEIVNYMAKGNMYVADFVIQGKQCWYLMNDKVKIKITRK